MDTNVDKKGIAGVSLVEVMISLVLVAFALIMITTVFPRIMGHRKGIYEAEQANILAMEVLEGLQYYSYYGCDKVREGDITPGDEKDAFKAFIGKYKNADNTVGIPMGAVTYNVDWWKYNLATDKKGGIIDCGGDINTATVSVRWNKSGKDHYVKMTGALK